MSSEKTCKSESRGAAFIRTGKEQEPPQTARENGASAKVYFALMLAPP